VAENKTPPPLASAGPYVCVDEGNASIRFVRPTLHHVPHSKDAQSLTKAPLAVVVTPMAAQEASSLIVGNGGGGSGSEAAVDVVDFPGSGMAGAGPVRCQRCKAYVNPFVKWFSNGEQWGCNLCSMVNPTPPFYRCPLDGAGNRSDAMSRPELCKGSVDFVTTSE
jgi:protein transport protein SEC24